MNIPSLKTKVGAMNHLQVTQKVRFGAYLDGRDLGDILLPARYVPEGCEENDFLDVFIYLDSEDRLVATTDVPLAMAGELAYLKVVAVTGVGAFLDWGLPKDLLVPFGEQREGMVRDRHYIVYIYFDKVSERLVASSKLHKFINPKSIRYKPGRKVDLLVGSPFDLGYTVIIEKQFVGVIYSNEIFQPVQPGQRVHGYIKQIRSDGKIDVELQKSGLSSHEALRDRILSGLREQDGFLPVTDKSPPQDIYERFNASKKAYKRAVGGLYKERLIVIEENGIRLTST